jgi:predicted dehydrogenase
MFNIGVVGYGYWGPNLVRNFSEADDATVVTVCDYDEKRLALAQRRHPGIAVTSQYEQILADPQIDVVAIATPVSSHFDLALQALLAGKHVFVEKPLTQSAEEGERLVEEADKRNLVLHVDHTFVYTGAVQKIGEMTARGDLGDIFYYDSVRINLGLFQRDVDVLWDLAVHDFSIMDYLFKTKPIAVSATGTNHVRGKPINIAFLTLFFADSSVAHLHVNWLAPVKVRRTLIGGSKRMIVYDDLEPSEKIKVYDRGINVAQTKEDIYEALLTYRTGDMWAPQLEASEALKVEIKHFLSCVENGHRTLTDGQSGLRIVRVLEAASRSMRERGRPVELNGEVREKGRLLRSC